MMAPRNGRASGPVVKGDTPSYAGLIPEAVVEMQRHGDAPAVGEAHSTDRQRFLSKCPIT